VVVRGNGRAVLDLAAPVSATNGEEVALEWYETAERFRHAESPASDTA